MTCSMDGQEIIYEDLWIGGDLVMCGGIITSCPGHDVQIIPAAGQITQVGVGVPIYAAGNDDLFVGGEVETISTIYARGSLYVYGQMICFFVVDVRDNVPIRLGDSQDATLEWNINQTNHAFMVGTDSSSRAAIMCQSSAIAAPYDFGHSNYADPSWIVHSRNQSQDEYYLTSHDTINAAKTIGKGGDTTHHVTPITLANNDSIDLPDSTAGMCRIFVGDMEEYADFGWDSSANVNLISWSANVATVDAGVALRIFGNGTSVRIRNSLGASKKIVFKYFHHTP